MGIDRVYDVLRKVKFAFLFLLVSAFSGFATWDELRFQLKGVPVEATVLNHEAPDGDRKVEVNFVALQGDRSARGYVFVGKEDLERLRPGTRHEALWLEGKRPQVRMVGFGGSAWLIWVFVACCGGLVWSVASALRGRGSAEPGDAPQPAEGWV